MPLLSNFAGTAKQVMTEQHPLIINSVRKWLEQFVIKLNLCPFAKQELLNNRVRFFVSESTSLEQLAADLQTELETLTQDESIETTLLIHPNVLTDFEDYNDFLDIADGLLIDMGLEGIYQIASFHPNYQFADTTLDDPENYTNRSPYPLLHLIREQSLERAIANYPDPATIPERNIALMNKMGKPQLQSLFSAYFDED